MESWFESIDDWLNWDRRNEINVVVSIAYFIYRDCSTRSRLIFNGMLCYFIFGT